MTWNGIFQIVFYMVILISLAIPLGNYMAKVYEGKKTFLSGILKPVEKIIYKLAGIHEEEEMGWKTFTFSLLLFCLIGFFVVYVLQRFQGFLPGNPQHLNEVASDLSFNTAMSFITNTNWQSYSGETTLSYLTQMAGLTVQNFFSAAQGIAVLMALSRAFVRQTAKTLGNFWVDLVRGILYILFPLSLILAVLLVSQGTVQNLSPYPTVNLVQPFTDPSGNLITHQVIATGPAASQIAIKQLGTNGGGFFGGNSTHPFENPNSISNFLELLSILLIPAALCISYGHMVGEPRQGRMILAVMVVLFSLLLAVSLWSETSGNPVMTVMGVDTAVGQYQSGGNMEGKETRFGVVNSSLWEIATTTASNGSVNSMHDSYNPLGGLAAMWGIQLGEVVFGGVGSGLYGMLMFVIIAVFVAGLMVGRTPEYLGKKIEPFEMKMASLVILIPIMIILLGTALTVLLPAGFNAVNNPQAHGFSEILYAFSSAAGNNGSAFAGLASNNLYYNIALAVVMFIGRFWLIIPVMAVAGSVVGKKKVPTGLGTLATDTPLFVLWLIAVVILVGALSFLPSLALGPIVEHLMLFH
jgi:K+-transporting ATPase ATPase A chain